MSPARSSVPLERDKRRRPLEHGEKGYKRGCKCGICMEGHAAHERERRAATSPATVSTATTASRRRAVAQTAAVRREVRVTARLSGPEAAAFAEQAAYLGDTGSGFLRDLILAAVSGKDSTAPAPPRWAVIPQDGDEDRKATVTVWLSEESAAVFRKHVKDAGGTQSGFIRDLILAAIGYEDDARRPARRRPNRERSETEGQQ